MNQSVFTNWEKSETLSISFDIKHDGYQYSVEGNFSYGRLAPFEVKYFYCDDLEEYTLVNVSSSTLIVRTAITQGDQLQYSLSPKEEVKLLSPEVSIAVSVKNYSD
jgi:hypothetical protein